MKINCTFCSKSFLQKFSFLISLSFSFCLSGFTQNFINEISEYNSNIFKEELYIQTDRDLYIVGEQLWLKIYKLNALSKKPDNVSKVVYIELLNSAGYPVKQIKLSVDKESESTGFNLPDTLSSGNYLLRAYTNWMKNYSEKDFSFKNISIINPFQSPDKIKIPSNKSIIDTVLFYPEGGALVSGLKSKVGFKAIDKSGRPKKIAAALVNEKMDTICLTRTENTGFGTFFIKPDHTDIYKLLYTNETGNKQSFPLGKVEDSGIILSLNHSEKNAPIKVKINKSSDFNSGNNKYFILVRSGGLVNFVKEINLDREIELNLSRDELPYGISQIVLTNKNGEQLRSRWIFNESDKSIFLNVKLDKPKYGLREKVKLEINATDKQGNPIETDLVVSITKSCSINEDRISIDNRYTHLFTLRTGIRSYEAIDINEGLLFYTGDDFDLKKIFGSNKMHPQYLPELEGKILSGTLKSNTTDEPIVNKNVVFSFVGKAAQCQIYETNDSGDFHFVINEFGLQEIVIQPLEAELSDYYVELEPDFINSFNHFLPGSFYLDTSNLEELNKNIISMQIENIYQPYRQNNYKITTDSNFISFYGKPEYAVQISDFIRLTTVREVIKEIVPSVYTRKKDGEFFFKIISDIDGQVFENNPFVIVDGIPFNGIDQILNMRSTDLARIEVLNLRYFIDDHIFDGILNFTTRKGNLEAIDFDHTIFRQAYTTFSREVKFNSPDYSNDVLKNSRLPDFRNTLYWNPDLHTQKDGVVSFEFFTSDEANNYTILIEGISPDGQTGAVSKRLVVN